MKYVVYKEDSDGVVSIWSRYDTKEEADDVANEMNACSDDDTYYWVDRESD